MYMLWKTTDFKKLLKWQMQNIFETILLLKKTVNTLL